ncbi:hypothetical protein [Flavobacterium cerinum]|uniref:Uncharacterized protein n=1 Tax=Flavobacterium cerinum TaxID=2502784 RepID=A0A444HBR9_9FLAO|nr:hypothetical protein [Flavobacterium cerinum]RWX00909.1 hypothetical protein EPI11_07765 [Flavobacterium cerinum]
MALDTPGLETDFINLMLDMREKTEISDNEYAHRFSMMMEKYVKTAVIKYVGGLAAPNGPVTGTFEGTLE